MSHYTNYAFILLSTNFVCVFSDLLAAFCRFTSDSTIERKLLPRDVISHFCRIEQMY